MLPKVVPIDLHLAMLTLCHRMAASDIAIPKHELEVIMHRSILLTSLVYDNNPWKQERANHP